ncbi:MAG TPA: putative toxin-antitoxin system toxin component, PIN family [Verrucomicrobiae bacterium]
MRAVLDANVVASAVCWTAEAYRCFVKLARRQFFAYGTVETVREAEDVATHLSWREQPKHNAAARLNWYLDKVKMVEPAPLGKQRSRDAKDDPYLAAAISARANFIVSYDKDLLALEKPFGIEIIHPSQFLKSIKG